MGDNDSVVDHVAAETGAVDVAAPAQTPPSAAPSGDASAGVDRGAEQQQPPSSADAEPSLVDVVLERFPASADAEDDPIQPKPPPSDGADTSGQPADSQTPPEDGGEPPADQEEAAPEGRPETWLTDTEMKALSGRARARIEALSRDNRTFRQFASAAEPFLAPLRQHNIPSQDVEIAAGLIAAVNNGQYDVFLQAIEPYIQIAEEATGKRLPADLRRRVDEGEMTTEAAAEISRSRYVAAHAQARAKQVSDGAAAERRATADAKAQESRDTIAAAVNQWEVTQKASDPDFQRLRPLIVRQMIGMVAQHGQPPTIEDAVALANYCLAEVKKVALAGQPPPRTTRQPASPNGSARAPLRPEPKNVHEFVFQRLGIS